MGSSGAACTYPDRSVVALKRLVHGEVALDLVRVNLDDFQQACFQKIKQHHATGRTMPQGAACKHFACACVYVCVCVCVCVWENPPPCSPSPRPHDILNIHTRTQIQTFVATARNPAILAVPCNGIQWDWVGKSNLDFLAQVDEHGCQTWFHAQTHGHKRREKMGRRLQEGPVTWSHSTQREAERERAREREVEKEAERESERERSRKR